MTDNDGFSQRMVELTPMLQRMARKLARDVTLADDLVQETLLRAWANRSSFTPGTNQAAWMHTILRNCFLSDIRRKKRWREVSGDVDVENRSVSGGQEPAMFLDEILQAIFKLPKNQSDVLIMVGVEAMSYADAAREADCSVGTVKSRVSRAREHLRMSLEHDEMPT